MDVQRDVRQSLRLQTDRPACLCWSFTTDGEAEPTWTQKVSHEQTGHTEAPLRKEKRADFAVTFSNSFWDAVIVPIPVIKTSLYMCQRAAAFLSSCLPLHRVSEASAHYKPISLYQLIFTFDSVAALMGVGTRVSVHRNLNNVMKPGSDLIYNPRPWLNSIMSTPHLFYLWEK